MNKLRTWLIAGLAIALAITGLYYFSSQSQAAGVSEYQTEIAKKGNISALIGATGTVRANQSATLTWQTSGTVSEVLAVTGDKVKQDQLLASLQQTSLPQNVILAEADLINAKKSLDTLLESNTAYAQAEQSVIQARRKLEDAEENLEKMGYDRASDTILDQTEAEIDLAEEQLAKAQDAYKRFAKRPDGDSLKAQAQLNVTNAQIRLNDLYAEYNWYTGTYDELEREEARTAVEVAKANLEDAERELAQLQNGKNADDIAAAQARVAAAQATLNLSKIQAPFNGTITQTDPLPGDKVSTGSFAFRLDDLSRLLIDVEISEVDINAIVAGQAVTVNFDAIQDTTYSGTIIEVGRVASSSGGAVNFNVTVALTDADEFVRPGMTAAVTILTREQTDVLMVPNRAVRMVDGQRVVYILKDGNLQTVEVHLGASSDMYSEVVGGELQEGDQIVINPPASSAITPGNPGPGSGLRDAMGG